MLPTIVESFHTTLHGPLVKLTPTVDKKTTRQQTIKSVMRVAKTDSDIYVNARPQIHGDTGTWVVGNNVYSSKLGYKSVAWTFNRSGTGGALICGVCAADVPLKYAHLERARAADNDICFQKGVWGWHSEFGDVTRDGVWQWRVSQEGAKDTRMFGDAGARVEVRLDCVTGELTFTRLTGGTRAHTYTHHVPVEGGEKYRVCIDMNEDVCVELVDCVAHLM